MLDATSIRPDSILLLDTFFHVVVFHGETIAAWRAAGYVHPPTHPPTLPFIYLISLLSTHPPTHLLTHSSQHLIRTASISSIFLSTHPPTHLSHRYQQTDEHVNFRNLLEAPQHDAQMTMTTRFPVPR